MDEKELKQFHKSNKEIYSISRSKAWKKVKELFFEKIDDLQSVMNIDGKLSPEEMVTDIRVRRLVCEELVGMMKEIDGRAAQYEENELSPDETSLGHVVRS